MKLNFISKNNNKSGISTLFSSLFYSEKELFLTFQTFTACHSTPLRKMTNHSQPNDFSISGERFFVRLRKIFQSAARDLQGISF